VRKNLIAVALLVAVLGGTLAPSVAGAASAASRVHSHPAFLDKTRFVLHLGVAWFAFHHWVLKPYQKGAFKSGASGRVKNMIKGGVALLFTVHEVLVARDIANKSSSKTLHVLVVPLNALAALFTKTGSELKKGVLSVGDITNLSHSTSAIGSGVGGIKDIGATIPGT
jgi:hypothetical protein